MSRASDRNFYITSAVITSALLIALAVKHSVKSKLPTPKSPTMPPEYLGPPLKDYKITVHTNIPTDLRPWTTQVLTEAKEKLSLGENCNHLWQHGNYRVRLVLSDQPIAIQIGQFRLFVEDGALAVDGGKCFTLDSIVDTIKEMAHNYGHPIRYTSNNSMINELSGVDLLASARQS